jgi:hypothetical protein
MEDLLEAYGLILGIIGFITFFGLVVWNYVFNEKEFGDKF